MKKFTSITTLIWLALLLVLPSSGLAYNQISPATAKQMISSNPGVVTVDVRSNTDYCYYGHIPCALNMAWEDEFSENYTKLPTDKAVITVCQHGIRGAAAARFLDEHGYTMVYNISGGMTAWQQDGFSVITCEDENPDDCLNLPYRLYFPHIASGTGSGWETEIAIINRSRESDLTGKLQAFDKDGNKSGAALDLNLPPAGRRQLTVGSDFQYPKETAYIILYADSEQCSGYLKFFDAPDGRYRAAIPAIANPNQHDISLAHIATVDGWWTGLALLNTSTSEHDLTFTFNTGLERTVKLPAGAYKALNLAELIAPARAGTPIDSALISNADGVIGLEIFGNGNQLSGVSLKDAASKTLYIPHIAEDQQWWTGMVVYNPGQNPGELTVKPYAADGTPLQISLPTIMAADTRGIYPPAAAATPFTVGSGQQFIGTGDRFGLPQETAWMSIEASVPVTGLELFGTVDGNQLAGYLVVNIDGDSGILAKLEDNGWTGIALVNIGDDPISVTLEAFADTGGEPVARSITHLKSHEKLIDIPENLFTEDLQNATYIVYRGTGPVVAFQLNSNGTTMLDALPGR